MKAKVIFKTSHSGKYVYQIKTFNSWQHLENWVRLIERVKRYKFIDTKPIETD